MKQHYFDYNATGPMAEEVIEAMTPFFRDHFANASSLHQSAREPRKALREARRSVANLLGTADENAVFFTSGGTESNNTAILSAIRTSKRRKIITSPIEHSSVLRLMQRLAKEGYEIQMLPVDAAGRLDLAQLKARLSDEVALVSLMSANNETGILFPVLEAAELIHERGILFHVDAVQSAGKQPLVLKDSQIDFLSLSAHKFYGPKGIGALYVRPGVSFESLIAGGSQERGRRAGTENVAGIAGLGMAAELALKNLEDEIARLTALRNELETRLTSAHQGVQIVGAQSPRLPNTSLILFSGIDAEALLYALDAEGIAASSGSACMSGAREPSHVLTAMGFAPGAALSAVRFSLGAGSSSEEVAALCTALEKILPRLRACLPTKAGLPAEAGGPDIAKST